MRPFVVSSCGLFFVVCVFFGWVGHFVVFKIRGVCNVFPVSKCKFI